MQTIYSKLEFQWIESALAGTHGLYHLVIAGKFALQQHMKLQKEADFSKRIENIEADRFDDAELAISIYQDRQYRHLPSLVGIRQANVLLMTLDYENLDFLDRWEIEALYLAEKYQIEWVLFVLINQDENEPKVIKKLDRVFSNRILDHQLKYEEKLNNTLRSADFNLAQTVKTKIIWFHEDQSIWAEIHALNLSSKSTKYPFKYLDDFVEVPKGNLEIEDEHGLHQFPIEYDLYASQVPITQGFYQKVMKLNRESYEGFAYPANEISYLDAVLFCNRLSQICGLPLVYQIKQGSNAAASNPLAKDFEVIADFKKKGFRLPTQREWLYLATANASWFYAGSNDPDEVAWSFDNSGSKLHKVARLKPNAWGLYDLNGNVWEWCEDDHIQTTTTAQHTKCLQGGSFFNSPLLFPLLDKIWDFAGQRSMYNGFRVVLEKS
jgi:sulfatase modifying factor 1